MKKIKEETGIKFKERIRKTVEWYLGNESS